MIGLFISVAAASLVPEAAPSSLTPDSPVAPASAAVRIPFAPPVGEPLRYRQTNTQIRNGRPVTQSLDVDIVFTRDDRGYVMTATYLPPPGVAASHPGMAVLTRPLALRLDAQGAITGMVDEPGYWAGLDAIFDGVARDMGADQQAAAAMRSMFSDMRNLPDAPRLALISRNISPILEYASTEMVPGERLSGSLSNDTMFGSVVQDFETRLIGASPDEAQVEVTYRLAPDQMEAMFRNLEARFGRNSRERERAIAEVSVIRRDSFSISLQTGLADRHESIVTASGEEAGATGATRRVQRLERIR